MNIPSRDETDLIPLWPSTAPPHDAMAMVAFLLTTLIMLSTKTVVCDPCHIRRQSWACDGVRTDRTKWSAGPNMTCPELSHWRCSAASSLALVGLNQSTSLLALVGLDQPVPSSLPANSGTSGAGLSSFRGYQQDVAYYTCLIGTSSDPAFRLFSGVHEMFRKCFAASAALVMMTGVAVAQTSSSTTSSTQTTPMMPVPVIGGSNSSSSQQTTDSNGVVTDQTKTYSNGTTVTPAGTLGTTEKSTSTTTTR